MGKVELLCLGTGHHLSAVYEGQTSSSFVVLVDGLPMVLIGAGLGTIRACLHYLQLIPDTILLLNSTPSQCAELAALVTAETSKGRILNIFADETSCLAIGDALRRETKDESSIGYVLAQNARLIKLSLETSDPIPIAENLTMLVHPNQYRRDAVALAAVFYFRELPLFSLTGSCAFDTSLISKLCHVPFVLVWVRATGAMEGPQSQMFATASDVSVFAEKVNGARAPDERIVFLLTGFGGPQDSPMVAGFVSPCVAGCSYTLLSGEAVSTPYGALGLLHPNVKKGRAGTIHSSAVSGGAGASSLPPTTGKNVRGVSPGGGSGVNSGEGAGSSANHRSGSIEATRPGPTAAVTVHHPTGPASAGKGASRQQQLPGAGGAGQWSGLPQGGRASYPAVHADVTDMGNSSAPPQHNGVGGSALRHGHSGEPHGASPGQYHHLDDPSATYLNSSDQQGTDGSSRGANKRLWIFNNEDKGLPGRLLMLNRCRNLDQLISRCSEMTKLKPVKELTFADGRPLRSLAELKDQSELIVIRRGGLSYDARDLPRLMRSAQHRR
jgi:hypothetical protein